MKKLWSGLVLMVLAGCAGARAPILVTPSPDVVTPTVQSQSVEQTPQPVGVPLVGFVAGRVSIGPLGPGPQRANETPQPIPPDVLAAYIIRVYQTDGTTQVLDAKISSDGTYRISLPAGSYLIGAIRADGGRMFGGGQQSIEIQSGQTIQSDISIDTGLR